MERERAAQIAFVLKHGILGWGLTAGILWAFFMSRSSGAPLTDFLFPALGNFAIGGAIFGFVLWHFSAERAALRREASALAVGAGHPEELRAGAIYAYEPRFFSPDRLYLMRATRDALHCVRVGGQLMPLGGSYPDDPAAYVDPKLLEKYAGLDLLDPSALRLDPRNLLLPRGEIGAARIRTRRSLWTSRIPNSGSLRLELRSGGAKKFILLGKQDAEAVRAVLAGVGIETRLEP
jgi:hypothetical protein